MKFHYKFAHLTNDTKTVKRTNDAAERVYKALENLNTHDLIIDDCSKRYAAGQISNLSSTLRRFSFIVSRAVANSSMSYDDFVFVDYGGGVGFMSLLSKELGIGTVVYVDLSEIYAKDAKTIAKATGLAGADHYLHGDIDTLVEFLKDDSISCNGFGSYDVIEHIYDIEGFLNKLNDLSNDVISIVMGSSANPLNIIARKKFRDMHNKAEYGGREKEWGFREDYCTTAYVTIRKEIIAAHAPSLPESDVNKLAKATRGLIESDIKNVVDEYITTHNITYQPDHPTNTVNPYTGNWAERLHDLGHLKSILSGQGFHVQVLSGYYGLSKTNSMGKKTAGILMNMLITMLGRKGLIVAPFYTVYARKKF